MIKSILLFLMGYETNILAYMPTLMAIDMMVMTHI